MLTRWRPGGRTRDPDALQRRADLLLLHSGRLRNHAAFGAAADGSLRCLHVRHLRRRNNCGELADVAHQTLTRKKPPGIEADYGVGRSCLVRRTKALRSHLSTSI